MIKLTAIGNITKDVELKTAENGDRPYAVFRIASDRRYRDRDGNPITDFISVKVSGNLAELCARHLYTSCKVAVSGSFETVAFEGEPDRQSGFLIKANEVEFLSAHRKIHEAEKRGECA